MLFKKVSFANLLADAQNPLQKKIFLFENLLKHKFSASS